MLTTLSVWFVPQALPLPELRMHPSRRPQAPKSPPRWLSLVCLFSGFKFVLQNDDGSQFLGTLVLFLRCLEEIWPCVVVNLKNKPPTTSGSVQFLYCGLEAFAHIPNYSNIFNSTLKIREHSFTYMEHYTAIPMRQTRISEHDHHLLHCRLFLHMLPPPHSLHISQISLPPHTIWGRTLNIGTLNNVITEVGDQSIKH